MRSKSRTVWAVLVGGRVQTRIQAFLFESPKRLESSSALSFCLPVKAQEISGWQFDSLRGDLTVSKSDAQQIYEVLLKMLDRWNAHDIGGHLKVYWKSPELLVFVDSEQLNAGSNSMTHISMGSGYVARSVSFNPRASNSKLLKPDLALSLTWWSASFPTSKVKVVGNTYRGPSATREEHYHPAPG
jgi:hypothetical protein